MRNVTIAISGRAVAYNQPDDTETRERLRRIIDGAEVQVELEGVHFTITAEFDPHADDGE